MSWDESFEAVYIDPKVGLTREQIADRVRAGAVNEKVDSSTQTVKEIVRQNVCTYFNLIFLVLGILLVAAGSFRDLTFLPVIIANTCIGIFQEIQAKKVLDDLTILNAPTCKVIREGEEKKIKAEHLVLHDIAVLSSGDQIPADAEVLQGEVSVNESMITGESDEISKVEGDKLLSGSFIVSGKCTARLEKVGRDSYAAKLTLQATKAKKGEQSEMIKSLNRLV
ncbi:MAG: HAD-IC family P-type ATPase, partial [Lachnospiraceae bacterium]|nr:HAD-IC family P-type ATPase [Lachnospiraceae bacterium]